MDSLPPVLKKHWPLLAIALVAGLYGWALLVATASGHDGVIGPHFNAPGADWVIFMAAGRAFFTHDLPNIYNQLWITHAVNSQFADWLSGPEPFPLFPYPPVFLLMVLPFAQLPVFWSLLVTQVISFAALGWALRRYAPPSHFWFFLVGAFLAPAASNNVIAGTNAVLVAALVLGGFALLDRRPLLGGALLGLMIFKPQYFPLLPLALLAARQGRAFAAMCASAILFTLASVAVFGLDLWWDWINLYLHPQRTAAVNGSDWGHMWDESVSTCVTLLGLPGWPAKAAQGLTMLGSAFAVWRAWRAGHPLRLPILACAVLLASPHLSNYDLILLAVAAMTLLTTLPGSSRPLALVLPLAAWLAPLYNPPLAMPLGLVTPLVLAGTIWALWRAKPLGQQGAWQAGGKTV